MLFSVPRCLLTVNLLALFIGDDLVYTGNVEPALKQLMDQYYKTGGTIIGCQIVPDEQVSSYGIIDREKNDDEKVIKVRDIIEKPFLQRSTQPFRYSEAVCEYS